MYDCANPIIPQRGKHFVGIPLQGKKTILASNPGIAEFIRILFQSEYK